MRSSGADCVLFVGDSDGRGPLFPTRTCRGRKSVDCHVGSRNLPWSGRCRIDNDSSLASG